MTTFAPTDAPTDAPTPSPDAKSKFTLNEYIHKNYTGKSVYPSFVGSEYNAANKEDLYYESSGYDILVKDLKNAEFSETLASATNIEGMDDWFAYKVSNDASHIFFGYDNKKLWRSTSYNATYKLWSVAENKYIESIFDKTEFLDLCPSGPTNIQVLQWAPKKVAGAFICDFNMYYFSDPLNMSSVTKITSDGLDNEIYNGLPEWVYEEEMLGTNHATYWSPEGTQIMFVKFQTQTTQDRLDGDRDAHIYKYSWYGQEQYPETKEISFSKAGTTPPTNKLYMFDTTTKANVELGNQGIASEENYFARCDWLNEDNLVVVWTTRIQDKSVGHFFLKTGESWGLHPAAPQPSNAALYVEENGWVGSFGPWWPKYWNEGSYFTLRSKKVGTAGPGQEGFWTVARVDIGSEEPLFLAEHPSYTDTDLAHYDSAADVLYYYAAAPEPRHRQLHAIAGASKAEAASNPVCITCPLITKYPAGEDNAETRCGWINVVFHENNVIFNCRGGAGLPITVWKSLDTLMDESVDFAVLEDNAELATTLESVAMPKKVYGKYQLSTSNGSNQTISTPPKNTRWSSKSTPVQSSKKSLMNGAQISVNPWSPSTTSFARALTVEVPLSKATLSCNKFTKNWDKTSQPIKPISVRTWPVWPLLTKIRSLSGVGVTVGIPLRILSRTVTTVKTTFLNAVSQLLLWLVGGTTILCTLNDTWANHKTTKKPTIRPKSGTKLRTAQTLATKVSNTRGTQ